MSVKRLRRRATVAASALAAALALPTGAAPALAADAVPTAAEQLPATVSADSLPTVQINGVVWNQLVVGNTVYVAGQFTSARPAGSPLGSNETPRSNLLAYDITTGNLISSWAPTVNGVAYGLAASADGKKIYVSGSFTQANGQTQYRVAAFDATSGALISGFRPVFDARVRTIAVVGNTLYAGGIFSKVGSTPRARLAAVNATTGALVTGWAPTADAEVLAMVVPSSKPELVIAGRFGLVNGDAWRGSAALDLGSGANLPWDVQNHVYNYGDAAAVYSLSTDGTSVFGTGYNYGSNGNFENSFSAAADGGTFQWLNPCLGDTYGSYPLGGVLYTAGHAHDCSAMGGLPDLTPRQYQWALAATTAASGKLNPRNAYGWAEGTPANTQLHWTPSFTAGTYTGQSQSTWNVTGNGQYLLYGGEFPSVNGVGQQGIARFAVRSAAPNVQGPQGAGDLTPSATSTYPGQVRVTWRAAWDRDDKTLTYELLRGPAGNTTVVATTTASSEWWDRPPVALDDPSPLAGAQLYRVRVTDPSGNTVTGAASSVTATTAASAYAQLVKTDGASDYWRLNDRSGVVGTASIGGHDLTVDASEQRAQAGATADGDTSIGFTGVTQVDAPNRFGPSYKAVIPAATTYALDGPQTYTTEAWINTTTTKGGKIIGFGDSKRDYSSSYDRHVYMTDDGRLVAGVYDGSIRAVTSTKSYNDGQWHHVVATLGANGLSLYVDGVKVASNGAATQAQPFHGYWRIGGDNVSFWPNQPTSAGFAGSIDDVAIYPTALTGAQIRAHYAATGRAVLTPAKPSDTYGGAVYDSAPDAYWRLQETSGTALADSSPEGAVPAVVNGSPALGDPGVPGITGSTAVSFDGNPDNTVASAAATVAPSVYSEELWFKTTSTLGGKLIGFGDAQSGRSGAYDRHVWMDRNGTLHFGTWTGQENRADSTKAYNDGTWHHLVATQGAQGMALYVDGKLVGSNAQTGAQDYSGYWRVGGDASWGDTENGFFTGSIDDVAIYGRALTAADVSAHFKAGGGNLAPTSSFTATPTALALAVDGSGSTDSDGTVASFAWTFGDGGTGTGVTATHTYAAPGIYTVTLTTTDDKGATATSQQRVSVRSASAVAPADAYGKAVYDAGPDAYYRLDDAAGTTTAADSSGFESTGIVRGGVRTGTPGVAQSVGAGTGSTFDGQVGSIIVDPRRIDAPSQYSTELWFNTTSTLGGKLVGFGDAESGYSGSYDRHVWMDRNGTLHFGTWTGYANTVDTTTAYNDGVWHHVVATQGDAGMVLYVDGKVVGTNGQTQAQNYSGYWRVGGDSSWGDTENGFFAGAIDEVAFYSKAISASTVADHFAKGAPNQAPTAAFTGGAKDLVATFDASTSKDADGTVASYAWDFGDGSTGTGATPTHTYAAAGTYTVKVVVTDDKGATGTTTGTVTVTAPNQAPTAAFTGGAKDLVATFDASTSKDADGTVASYAWDFGDGSTGTGATPTHTYAAAGTYTVKLVVSDDKGATGTTSSALTVTAPVNQAPTASFASASKDLGATFDAKASADSDGTVASYAWTFGDGTSGTGVTAAHTYAAAGTYTVTLVVTDDKGATGTSTDTVVVTAPVVANQAPTASFTSAVTKLQANLDASASKDADGTVASYAWDFGDGTTGTGKTVTHAYAAAGTYQVTLTVTDNKGATGTSTASVTASADVQPQPTNGTVAADAFGRTTSGGWGTADTGGAWTTSGGASAFSTGGGTGRMVIAKPGATLSAALGGVSASGTDLQATFSVDRAATGGGVYLTLQGRKVGNDDYRVTARQLANGSVSLILGKVVGGTSTTLKAVTVPGVTVGAGQQLVVRLQTTGSGTTTLSAKAWLAGSAEPSAFQVTATDAAPSLQTAGGIGVVAYLSGSSTNAPTTVSVSNLKAIRS
ncbi:PKD repeat-containing protein [Quadrisphaera granulorum]|uniref:PKD repeat protein n=1 Tax=Quadrisphaera granulorum TaxID=317664 RepID=A0A316AGG6_9ACTN|nr:PKD domain-containing protein [Quadrisphaera granulorum]PWJ56040.1 PKD repeat protein [Quadrisphaera granulorum]SZE94674.1 PKD repeat-containing protein [Quadrisphaera granulorum]